MIESILKETKKSTYVIPFQPPKYSPKNQHTLVDDVKKLNEKYDLLLGKVESLDEDSNYSKSKPVKPN